MKKNRSATFSRKSGIVKVLLTVTKFRDVLCEQGAVTDYVMSLGSAQTRCVRLEKDILFVKPPGVTLQFVLTSSRDDRENYYPLGISYVRAGDSKNEELRLGLINFPQKKEILKSKAITITDSYRDKEKRARYKFSIFVQRGSDGKVGIIDPGIIHDNADPH